MKRCSKCKQTKPLIEFSNEKSKPDGKYSYCKVCGKEWQQDIKRTVINHYGGVCACCGEKEFDFLTIDHINNDGKEDRKKHSGGGFASYQYFIKNNFPEGLQVLCFNCNLGKKVNKGICPHKKVLTNLKN